ncbi:MAG TPA: hypothetical protein PK821_06540 [Victivallales bacterium]|nr:hypothetical protein [Victivallales bacterium]
MKTENIMLETLHRGVSSDSVSVYAFCFAGTGRYRGLSALANLKFEI